MRLPAADSVATAATAVSPIETIEADASVVKVAAARVSSAK
jgi:hypothetical protein